MRSRKVVRPNLLGLGGAALICSFAANVCVQEASAQVTSEGEALEEIIVTAQQREQAVQDVPISLEVLGGDEIKDQGFGSFQDIQNFTPALNISADMQNQVIMIRGVGTQGSNFGFEQATPTFVDGVHFGRGSQIHAGFLDVERVEILRGPQPVYFGQNATAGALSIVSRKPTPEWEGNVLFEAGNDDIKRLELGAGGPVTDTFGIRVAGKYDSTDGHMTDAVTGSNFPHRRFSIGRTILQWSPTENLEVTVKGEAWDLSDGGQARTPVAIVNRQDEGWGVSQFGLDSANFRLDGNINDVGMQKRLFFAPPLSLTFVRGRASSVIDLSQIADTVDFGGSGKGFEARQDAESRNGYLKISYLFPDGTELMSQTSYSDYLRDYVAHFGSGGPFVLEPLLRGEDLRQYSQELRLTSSSDVAFEWIVGAYWQTNDLKHKSDFWVADTAFQLLATRGHNEDTWKSVFGAVTFDFLDDRASLDLGVRYSDVHKDGFLMGLGGQWIVEGGGIASAHGQVAIGHTPVVPTGQETVATYDTNSLDPQVVLRWRPTDDISTYAKWARSFKSGGFDSGVVTVQDPFEFVFGDEEAESWEVGAKNSFWDGRGNAELSLFWSEFDGLQLSSRVETAGSVGNITRNIGLQRVRGAEFRTDLLLTEQLTLHVSGAVMDGKILSFPGATCTREEIDLGLCTGPDNTIDRSGEDAIRTPDWELVTNANYLIPVLDRFQVELNANFMMSDGYLTDDSFERQIRMDKHEDLNLRVGFGPDDESWEVALWGRNLLEPLPTYFPENDLNDETEVASVQSSDFMSYGVSFFYQFE